MPVLITGIISFFQNKDTNLFLDRLSFKLPYSTYSPIHLFKLCWRFKQTWQVFLEHCETHFLKFNVPIISRTQLSCLCGWWWHNVILWIQRCQKYTNTTHLRSLVYLHDKWWQYPLFQIRLWSLSTRTHDINIVYKYHWWWPATSENFTYTVNYLKKTYV